MGVDRGGGAWAMPSNMLLTACVGVCVCVCVHMH